MKIKIQDSANMDISETHIKTDDMNIKAKINQSMINLDPNTGDNKNINVGNDIIVNKRFRIAGYPYDIDIPLLRYIKYIPLHFEEEICLRDWQGSDCINKKHVEVVKGDRKINLKTYPENKRMCLGAVDILHKKHLYHGPSSNKVFTSKNCKNGDLGIQFELHREPHNHYGDDKKIRIIMNILKMYHIIIYFNWCSLIFYFIFKLYDRF